MFGKEAKMQQQSQSWIIQETKSADFGDARLNKRFTMMLTKLSTTPSGSIPATFASWGETLAAYRFFDNEQVSVDNILSAHREATINRVKKENVVLMIQDTSEIDYTHRADIDGMGPLSYESQQGFYLHPSLVVTPNRTPLGVIDAKMWSRKELGIKRTRKQRPIEEKESYRWVEGFSMANDVAQACPDTLVVNIMDREGDIYELLMQSAKTNAARWIIRSAQNRKLASEDETLNKIWDKIRKKPNVAEIEFELPKKEDRKKRVVKQIVKTMCVTLCPPQRNGIKLPEVKVNVVFCTEKQVPKGDEALEWLLLTSVEIDDAERAIEIIKWYLCRWEIEIFFKILKTGCKIEELQFENFERTKNCVALYMIVAWRIQYLTMLGRSCPEISCDVVFDSSEWKAVYAVVKRKQPPKKAPKLNEMITMIATLGGYLGRKHDAEAGPKAMWIGMQRMRDFALSWEVMPGMKQ